MLTHQKKLEANEVVQERKCNCSKNDYGGVFFEGSIVDRLYKRGIMKDHANKHWA